MSGAIIIDVNNPREALEAALKEIERLAEENRLLKEAMNAPANPTQANLLHLLARTATLNQEVRVNNDHLDQVFCTLEKMGEQIKELERRTGIRREPATPYEDLTQSKPAMTVSEAQEQGICFNCEENGTHLGQGQYHCSNCGDEWNIYWDEYPDEARMIIEG